MLEFATAEARQLNQSNVDAEHLLLGLLREEKGTAAHVLNSFGVTLTRVRAAVMQTLSDAPVEASLPD